MSENDEQASELERLRMDRDWREDRIHDFDVEDNESGGCDLTLRGEVVATLPSRDSPAFTLMLAGAIALGNVSVFDCNRPEYLASPTDEARAEVPGKHKIGKDNPATKL